MDRWRLSPRIWSTPLFYFCQNLKVIGRYSFRASCTAPEVVERLRGMASWVGWRWLAAWPARPLMSASERLGCACLPAQVALKPACSKCSGYAHVRTYPSFNKTGATTLSNHAPVLLLLHESCSAPKHGRLRGCTPVVQSPRRCCLLEFSWSPGRAPGEEHVKSKKKKAG